MTDADRVRALEQEVARLRAALADLRAAMTDPLHRVNSIHGGWYRAPSRWIDLLDAALEEGRS